MKSEKLSLFDRRKVDGYANTYVSSIYYEAGELKLSDQEGNIKVLGPILPKPSRNLISVSYNPEGEILATFDDSDVVNLGYSGSVYTGNAFTNPGDGIYSNAINDFKPLIMGLGSIDTTGAEVTLSGTLTAQGTVVPETVNTHESVFLTVSITDTDTVKVPSVAGAQTLVWDQNPEGLITLEPGTYLVNAQSATCAAGWAYIALLVDGTDEELLRSGTGKSIINNGNVPLVIDDLLSISETTVVKLVQYSDEANVTGMGEYRFNPYFTSAVIRHASFTKLSTTLLDPVADVPNKVGISATSVELATFIADTNSDQYLVDDEWLSETSDYILQNRLYSNGYIYVIASNKSKVLVINTADKSTTFIDIDTPSVTSGIVDGVVTIFSGTTKYTLDQGIVASSTVTSLTLTPLMNICLSKDGLHALTWDTDSVKIIDLSDGTEIVKGLDGTHAIDFITDLENIVSVNSSSLGWIIEYDYYSVVIGLAATVPTYVYKTLDSTNLLVTDTEVTYLEGNDYGTEVLTPNDFGGSPSKYGVTISAVPEASGTQKSWNAFNTETRERYGWLSENNTTFETPSELRITADPGTKITANAVYLLSATYQNDVFEEFTVEAQLDDDSWVEVASMQKGTKQEVTLVFSAGTVTAKAFRILFYQVSPWTRVGVSNCKLLLISDERYRNIIPNLKVWNDTRITVSGTQGRVGNELINLSAFGNTLTDEWLADYTDTAIVEYDLGGPTYVSAYTLLTSYTSPEHPTQWVVEGWIDDTWVMLDDMTDAAVTGNDVVVKTVFDQRLMTKVRLVISGSVNPGVVGLAKFILHSNQSVSEMVGSKFTHPITAVDIVTAPVTDTLPVPQKYNYELPRDIETTETDSLLLTSNLVEDPEWPLTTMLQSSYKSRSLSTSTIGGLPAYNVERRTDLDNRNFTIESDSANSTKYGSDFADILVAPNPGNGLLTLIGRMEVILTFDRVYNASAIVVGTGHYLYYSPAGFELYVSPDGTTWNLVSDELLEPVTFAKKVYELSGEVPVKAVKFIATGTNYVQVGSLEVLSLDPQASDEAYKVPASELPAIIELDFKGNYLEFDSWSLGGYFDTTVQQPTDYTLEVLTANDTWVTITEVVGAVPETLISTHYLDDPILDARKLRLTVTGTSGTEMFISSFGTDLGSSLSDRYPITTKSAPILYPSQATRTAVDYIGKLPNRNSNLLPVGSSDILSSDGTLVSGSNSSKLYAIPRDVTVSTDGAHVISSSDLTGELVMSDGNVIFSTNNYKRNVGNWTGSNAYLYYDVARGADGKHWLGTGGSNVARFYDENTDKIVDVIGTPEFNSTGLWNKFMCPINQSDVLAFNYRANNNYTFISGQGKPVMRSLSTSTIGGLPAYNVERRTDLDNRNFSIELDSLQYGGYYVTNLVAPDPGNGVMVNDGNMEVMLTFDRVYYASAIVVGTGYHVPYAPLTFELYISSDGVTWNLISDEPLTPEVFAKNVYELSGEVPVKAVKFIATGTSFVNVGSLEVLSLDQSVPDEIEFDAEIRTFADSVVFSDDATYHTKLVNVEGVNIDKLDILTTDTDAVKSGVGAPTWADPSEVIYEFDEPVEIVKYISYSGSINTYNYHTLYGSNDKLTWDEIMPKKRDAYSTYSLSLDVDIAPTQSYKYYKLVLELYSPSYSYRVNVWKALLVTSTDRKSSTDLTKAVAGENTNFAYKVPGLDSDWYLWGKKSDYIIHVDKTGNMGVSLKPVTIQGDLLGGYVDVNTGYLNILTRGSVTGQDWGILEMSAVPNFKQTALATGESLYLPLLDDSVLIVPNKDLGGITGPATIYDGSIGFPEPVNVATNFSASALFSGTYGPDGMLYLSQWGRVESVARLDPESLELTFVPEMKDKADMFLKPSITKGGDLLFFPHRYFSPPENIQCYRMTFNNVTDLSDTLLKSHYFR